MLTAWDSSADKVTGLGDRVLELTRKEALLLETLLRAAGRSCSKAELLEASAASMRDVGEETTD
jgi:DNA-binding response OmpR family regulator